MPRAAAHACERCARALRPDQRCPRHPGARRLDLRRPADAEWRDDLLRLRRGRQLRALGFLGTGGAALAGLGALALFLGQGSLSRELLQSCGLAPLVAQLVIVALVVADVAVAGLALANLGRWAHNAWCRRQGELRVDPLAWRKLPYVVGALLHAALVVAQLALGAPWTAPGVHLGAAAVAAVLVFGGQLAVDILDLARRLTLRERDARRAPAPLAPFVPERHVAPRERQRA